MEGTRSTSRCLLSHSTVLVANSLSSPRGSVNSYELNCLALLLEAVVLYDQVLIYDYKPLVAPMLKKGLKDISILSGVLKGPQACVEMVDSFEDLSFEEQAAVLQKSLSPYRSATGDSSSATPAIGRFYQDMKGKMDLPFEEIEKLVRVSLTILGIPDLLEQICEEDRKRIILDYMGTKLWRVDLLRKLGKRLSATGLFLKPEWGPFWYHERNEVMSVLHGKFKEAEKTLTEKRLGAYSELDVSPLTVVALDTTLTPEMLPETIRLMRRDYAELRATGSMYGKSLEEVETYGEVADVVDEWSLAWERVLKKIASPSVPLVRKLFGWDMLKKGSARELLVGSVEMVMSEWENRGVMKRLSCIGMLEKEFLASRRVQKRLGELYGGYRE